MDTITVPVFQKLQVVPDLDDLYTLEMLCCGRTGEHSTSVSRHQTLQKYYLNMFHNTTVSLKINLSDCSVKKDDHVVQLDDIYQQAIANVLKKSQEVYSTQLRQAFDMQTDVRCCLVCQQKIASVIAFPCHHLTTCSDQLRGMSIV